MQTIKRNVQALIAKGAFTAAITAAADFSRRNPGKPECFGLIAEAEESAGYTKAAIQSVSHAIALAPQEPAYRILRSRLYVKDKQLEKAIADINQLVAMANILGNADFIHDAVACRDELLERLTCQPSQSVRRLTGDSGVSA